MIGGVKDAIIARRGKEAKNIAKVAAARRLLTPVFHGMRRADPLPDATRRPARGTDGAGGMNSCPWPAARREAAKHSAPRQARGRKLFCPPPPGGRAPI